MTLSVGEVSVVCIRCFRCVSSCSEPRAKLPAELGGAFARRGQLGPRLRKAIPSAVRPRDALQRRVLLGVHLP